MGRIYLKRADWHQLGVEPLGLELPRFFDPRSWRNRRLRDDHPTVVDANGYARKFARQVRYTTTTTPQALYGAGYQSIINVGSPIYIANASTPRGRVNVVENIQDGGVGGTPVPDDWALGLPLEFLDVPFPPGIDGSVSFGGDHAIQIYDAPNQTLYEFWRFFRSTQYPPYAAAYGGRIQNISRANPVHRNNWGVSASSISQAAGMIRAQEIIDGAIRHALSVNLPVVAAGHLAPATRDDGLTNGSSFILGGDFDYTAGTQPELATLAADAAVNANKVTLAAIPTTPGPGLYDIGIGTTSSEPRVNVISFSTTTPCVATLGARLTKPHAAGSKFSISPLYDAVPEGARFRFPSNIVINPTWTPLTKMLVLAISRYGVFVTDKGGTFAFNYEVGQSVPYNPLSRGGYGNGGTVISQIPWESLIQISPEA